jgi:outer membrane PBP1 activator LpoA protein
MVTSAAAQTPARSTPLGADLPHIALLLPVDSSTFARHAEALRDGFMAASQLPDPSRMQIRVYAVGEDPKRALASYQQAVSMGARLVVGPLVRAAVNTVAAGDIPVPTLMLNAPDGVLPNRPNLYVISLQIEAEARQIARLAYQEGRRNAYTVAAPSVLLRRVHQAFVEAFMKLGGRHTGEFQYSASPAELDRLREAATTQGADMVFLALDAQQTRSVRPALGTLPLYASSQSYSADAGTTLAGVRMLDMPWLLERDHPAVMIYPRPSYDDADLERLYALGIDAWRVGQAILARHTDITLDGVTGKLTMERDRQFSRELVTRRLGGPAPAVPPGPVSPAAPLAFPPALRN